MIDLHMHTVYSDGKKTVAEVLKMCEEKKLEYISITDHNTCKQYEDIALKNNVIFHGKIIYGSELTATFQNKNIEILAYNINPNIINEWSAEYFSEENLRRSQEVCKKRMLDICDKHGLIYDNSKIKYPKEASGFVEGPIYNELLNHKENYSILGEYANSFNIFYRKALTNPDSSYCMHFEDFRASASEIINLIHKAGGKGFLAHPFEYRLQDTIKFIDDLKNGIELDGIECYHPSANDEQMQLLVDYARANKLYISGGSDYHGKTDSDIQIGVGHGNLRIPKEIIEEWI